MARAAQAPGRGVALVTGASSGIGEQIAVRLARLGYDLLLVARNEARLREVGERLERELHIRATPIAADLAMPNAAVDLVRRVRDLGVEVEILINNAGYAVHGAFASSPERAELDMLQVNVMSLVHLTKLLLPSMIERRRGRVLNVSSTAAFVPGPYMAAYYASKAFVLSFSEAIAAELKGTGLTVTAVCPGPTTTRFAETAGVVDTPLFHRAAMTPDAVADSAVAALMAGKPMVITGLRNRLLAFASRFGPRRALVTIAKRLNAAR